MSWNFLNKKAIVSFLGSIVVVSVILAGCNSQEEGDKTVSVLIDTDQELEGYEAVAEEIEKQFDIKTDFQRRPAGGEGDNSVKTKLSTDSMEDIFLYNSGSKFNELDPSDNLVDLSDESYMEDLQDEYKDVVSEDENVYGVPAHASMVGGWLYNKEVYDDLDLSVPKTWDELMENNEEIKEANKVPVIQSYEDTHTAQLIVLSDYYNVQKESPDFAEELTANEASFETNPAALRSFEKLQEIHDAGYMNENVEATDTDKAYKMLVEGEGAHYPALSSGLRTIDQNYPDDIDKIGMFGQPGSDEEEHGATIWMPSTFYISKESENIDAAKQWLEFFSSPEAKEIYMEHDKPEGPYINKQIELPDDVYPAVRDINEYFESGNTAPALEFQTPLKGPNLEQILVSVGTGMMSAEEGAEEYDKDLQKQAEQLNLPNW